MRQQQSRAPVSVFYSYAHADEALRQQLETHLSLLRRQGLISEWHDPEILPGAEWAGEIDEHLERASIILLLISADFLASDYCYDKEMTRALERHKRGEARVVPIILRPCDWKTSPFARLQSLPRDGKAVTTWQDKDEAFLAIAEGLRRVIERQQIPTRPLPKVERQNRTRLIKRVRTIWIEGLLEDSLRQTSRFELHLQERPDVLANPWRLHVQELDRPPQDLPPGVSIVQVFDEAEGELLILGEPGAGKTTLLLELARTLLDRAEADERERIPVVFNLSSWAQKRPPFTEWLIGELSTKYQVPHKLGRSWVASDQLLPLLDGLDEVAENARSACVQAINAYYQNHLEKEPAPLAICCRSQEYAALPTRAALHRAVSIQPLTDDQIDHYLQSTGSQLEALRRALYDNPVLQELVTTPLMLSVLTMAYYGKSVEDFRAIGSVESQRPIFTAYVQCMLQRRGVETRFTQEQTICWLARLAHEMTRHSQMEFYVERMQLDWLPNHWLRLVYRLLVSVICSLSGGLLLGLVGELIDGTSGWLVGGLLLGLLGGFIVQAKSEIKPAEAFAWSWQSAWRGLIKGFLFVVVGAMLAAFLFVQRSSFLIFWVTGEGGTLALRPLALAAMVVAVVFSNLAIGAFLGGLSSRTLDEHTFVKANQGIRRSAQNSVVVGLSVGLSSGLGCVLFFEILPWSFSDAGYSGQVRFLLLAGLIVGVFIGSIGSLMAGGTACIQHLCLRLVLLLVRVAPWNYPSFLDYAAERILLRKIGGGYIFIHRLLLDYFASLETTPTPSEEAKQAEPPSTTP